MITEIVIPHATPSLNQTIKHSYYAKTSLRKRYEKIIWAMTRNQHKGPVRLEIYRHSAYGLDHENFVGGAKALVDALTNQKVIIDDNAKWVPERHYEQVKISRAQPKMTVIKIIDLNPATSNEN